MDKRRLHHYWTQLRWIKPWYILVLALLSGLICIFALRANNQHMVTLRNAVYVADKNNADVQTPLRSLQDYVTHHMNTNLSTGTSVYPPIQLKYTYDRLVAARSGQASKTKLYNDAQHYCEALNHVDFSGHNRVPCIEHYVLAHTPAKQPAIPDALYKFAFVSPRWSPDLAGWSMFFMLLFLGMFVVWLAAYQYAKRFSK